MRSNKFQQLSGYLSLENTHPTINTMANKSFFMISLPIRLSKKYQVNQVNHEVGKKHNKESTYNKPNILILIKIPCKYLVIIPPFPKVIPQCNYLVKHLFMQHYNIHK